MLPFLVSRFSVAVWPLRPISRFSFLVSRFSFFGGGVTGPLARIDQFVSLPFWFFCWIFSFFCFFCWNVKMYASGSNYMCGLVEHGCSGSCCLVTVYYKWNLVAVTFTRAFEGLIEQETSRFWPSRCIICCNFHWSIHRRMCACSCTWRNVPMLPAPIVSNTASRSIGSVCLL